MAEKSNAAENAMVSSKCRLNAEHESAAMDRRTDQGYAAANILKIIRSTADAFFIGIKLGRIKRGFEPCGKFCGFALDKSGCALDESLRKLRRCTNAQMQCVEFWPHSMQKCAGE